MTSTQAQTPATLSVQELRALLAKRLSKATGQPEGGSLSFAQQRLWFLDQLFPNSPMYNIPCVLRLKGTLDIEALQKSLNALAERHESLRARFISSGGKPAQVLDEDVSITISQEDLSGMESTAREEEMMRRVRAELNRPFSLSRDRLLRVSVLRIGAEEHVAIFILQHIIGDEWSMQVFFRELTALYTGFVTGSPASLPKLPIQYSDYASWQHEWMNGPVCARQIAYWKRQLEGNPAGTELPTDRPRRPTTNFPGACETRPLGKELTEGLKNLAGQEGATLFMLMLAAFKVLLYRYTQQEDILIGSPMACRNRMETENLIGLFVNTVPLRTRLAGDLTFQQLLARVREVALEAYSNQDLPFEKLVEALQPNRSANSTPFVKIVFLLQNGLEDLRLPRLQAEFIDLALETSKFDLTLCVGETPTGLAAAVEYNTNLFEAETIKRLLQHYESLLQGIVALPAQRLSELPLLSEAERRQLTARWSPAAASHAGQCLHQWFAEQVRQTPEATAVVFGEEGLTYRELNDQANQLAHFLQRHGVRPETHVALHLERSLKMVVAILAVLKAGGAYVPMDPTWPKERLGFMLEDTQARIVLSLESLRAGLPAPGAPASLPAGSEAQRPAGQDAGAPGAKVVCLDSDWETIALESTEDPLNTASDQNTAYIIYTSGSTGKPKGVLVTHHNAVRLFEQTEAWYGFNSNDVWTLFHSYTFDFSVWELWGALLYGGRLVVVPYLISRSPNDFYTLLAKERVTVLNQTPSAFRQLLWAEATAPAPLPLSLRYIIFGGEALELQSLRPWFDRHGDERPRLVNMYGITETTVHVTYRVIRQADLANGLGSVIGVPIPDLRIYLLDEKLQPVPAGIPGEICVAGAGVARGYLNRPELTSQRFIADPFSQEPGARLYRSGDLARYTAEGELEYLGRMDHQVKIRGFRVELGEIESALNQCPGIRESVVLAADGPGGSKRLVAYLVPSGPTLPLAAVREGLEKRLPDYMVPAAFVWMAALPLTSNGKVDRRALPAPDGNGNTATVTGPEPVAPRNETERVLAEIWSQLLSRPAIGIHDSFFHLGGHSLLAAQVVARVGAAFNVDLPVRAIFETPTIAGLAEVVSRAQPNEVTTIVPRLQPATAPKNLLARLERLSDDQLQTLLENPKLKEDCQ